MSDKKEHWSKNPWIVGIVLLIFTPPLSGLWDVIKGIPYWTTLTIIWNWFVNCELKLWWVLVYFLLLGVVKAVKDEIKKNSYSKPINSIVPKYLRFTAVKYGNYRWRWEYIKDDLTKLIEIDNLFPVCNQKDCENNPLSFVSPMDLETRKYYNGRRICSKCGTNHYVDKSEFEMMQYISEKIQNNSFIITTDEVPEFVKQNLLTLD